jgi:PAS domain S-box-containing protein
MICNELWSPVTPSLQPVAFVVDDDPSQRIMLQSVLMQVGLEVKEAENGYEALQLLKQFTPSIILMDVKMPGIDGIETCQRIRQSPKGKDIPIVLITGLEDHDSILRAFKADATDFLTKPVNWTILRHRIEYLLKSGNAFQALRRSESHLKNAQEVATLGSWEYDLINDKTHVSEQVFDVFGDRPQQGNVKDFFFQMVLPEDLGPLMAVTQKAMAEGIEYKIDYRINHKDGIERTIHEQAKIRYDLNGQIVGAYGTVQDITDRKQAEDKIRHLAYFDSLTQLPNRDSFKKNAISAIAKAKNDNGNVAIMFIDLDNFKRINDVFGHDIGDVLLQKVALNLMDDLRATDCISKVDNHDNQTSVSISRLGGDEFTDY